MLLQFLRCLIGEYAVHCLFSSLVRVRGASAMTSEQQAGSAGIACGMMFVAKIKDAVDRIHALSRSPDGPHPLPQLCLRQVAVVGRQLSTSSSLGYQRGTTTALYRLDAPKIGCSTGLQVKLPKYG